MADAPGGPPGAAAGSPGPARLGLLVNPIAGMGGRVGLKGTDGAAVLARARALGAEPRAGQRAWSALQELLRTWPADQRPPRVLTVDGPMGREVADAAALGAETVAEVATPSTAADTRSAAAALREAGADLLLFAGGDGTARDVSSAIDRDLPALGIPAGVKIQSAVFAASPRAAGALAASFLAGPHRETVDRDVVDLDEEAYREGRIRPRLHGYLRVPRGRLLQSRKAPSPASERASMSGIAAAVIEMLPDHDRIILGPGTTTRAIAEGLGLPKTLVGVDVIAHVGGRAELLSADATEADLLRIAAEGSATIVLTPIGGQGFLLGRGNQQISPEVIRAVGIDRITVVATPEKLAALGGRPLLVDTGDLALDAQLCGHTRVISGRDDRAIVEVAAA